MIDINTLIIVMKIKTKVALILLLLSFSLITIMTSVFYFNTKSAITEIVLNNLDSIATIQKSHILNNIDNTFEKLNLIKNRIILKNNLEKYYINSKSEYLTNISKSLNDALPSIKSFKSISVIDKKGIILMSTEKRLINENFSQHEAFINGLKKDTIDTFFIDKFNNPSIYFSGVIIKNKQILGVALIESYPSQILPINHEFTGLGKTGEVTSGKRMKDGNILAISPLRFMPNSFLKLVIPIKETKRPIVQAMKGNESIFPDMINYREKKILAVTRYLPIVDWGITVNIDQDEVFEPLYKLQRIVLTIILMILFFTILIALYVSHLFTRPIINLTNTAIKISNGDLSERIEINSKDEIGVMASSFNKMAESLIYANNDLLQKNESLKIQKSELERFTYISSHDLQEPLRSITSFTELLEKNYKNNLDNQSKEYINLIIKSSKRMKDQINDFLDYVKINNKTYQYQKTDLNTIFKDVLNDISHLIKENNSVINTTSLPTLTVSPDLIFQLFKNLIFNSLKYRTSQQPIVNISSEYKDNQWYFKVSDNGIGIEEKYHSKIFEIFQRLHSREKYEGSGIGLATCKKIVELHSGKIWVESNAEIGTSFYFTIHT